MVSDTFLGDEYLNALGAVTATWAVLETGVDFLVAITFHEYGEHPKHHEIPRSMKRKIAYLRDYAGLSSLAHWQTELLELARTSEELKEKRHAAVHGCVDATLGEKVQLFRILYKKTQHELTDTSFTADDLSRLAAEIIGVGFVALNIAKALLDELDAKAGD